MDHLGIRRFMVIGYCIGGPFIWKLIERAPERIVAAVVSQPVGFRKESNPMCDNSMQTWGPALVKQRPDLTMDMIDKFLTRMYVTNADFVFSVPRDVVQGCQAPCWSCRTRPIAPRARHRVGDAGPEVELTFFPWKDTKEKIPRGAARAHVPQGEPAGLIPMPASKYVRPTVWVPPAVSAGWPAAPRAVDPAGRTSST